MMYSGHPMGLFPSSPHAPRVVVTNGMVCTCVHPVCCVSGGREAGEDRVVHILYLYILYVHSMLFECESSGKQSGII